LPFVKIKTGCHATAGSVKELKLFYDHKRLADQFIVVADLYKIPACREST
jgi:hypothetical protein